MESKLNVVDDEVQVFYQHESNARSYCNRFPVVFKRALGSYLYDGKGRGYLDFLCCAGTANYGHNNPIIRDSVIKFLMSEGLQASLDMHTDVKAEFIETFKSIILSPRNLDYKLQFTSPSGTSVVESAIKLARKVTKRRNIVAFSNAFHGMSGISLGLTSNSYYKGTHVDSEITRLPFDGYIPGFDSTEYLDSVLSGDNSGFSRPAAVIVETVQGEGGINLASDEWLIRLRRVTEKYGIQLIIDDIQAGCGRTGTFFSFERSGIVPDLVCLSKSLSGYGFPFALLLIKRDCDQWQAGEDNGTFRGNSIAFVSATKSIREFWSNGSLSSYVSKCSIYIEERLNALREMYPDQIKDVRGKGLFWGIELIQCTLTSSVQRLCFNRGLILETSGCRGQVIKIMPALNIPLEDLVQGMQILESCVAECFIENDTKEMTFNNEALVQ